MVATVIFPLEVWTSQITQASVPANNNSLRIEVLERAAIDTLSAPPGSPAEGDLYVLGSTPSGAWSTFTEHNLTIYKGGTWLEFEAFDGWVKYVDDTLKYFNGTSWQEVTAGGGGGGGSTFAPTVSITASETLAIGRAGYFINAAHASTPIVITVPPNSSVAFAVDTEIHIRQSGDAAVSLASGSGVTIEKPVSNTAVIKEKFGVVTIKKTATDTWTLFGLLGV